MHCHDPSFPLLSFPVFHSTLFTPGEFLNLFQTAFKQLTSVSLLVVCTACFGPLEDSGGM